MQNVQSFYTTAEFIDLCGMHHLEGYRDGISPLLNRLLDEEILSAIPVYRLRKNEQATKLSAYSCIYLPKHIQLASQIVLLLRERYSLEQIVPFVTHESQGFRLREFYISVGKEVAAEIKPSEIDIPPKVSGEVKEKPRGRRTTPENSSEKDSLVQRATSRLEELLEITPSVAPFLEMTNGNLINLAKEAGIQNFRRMTKLEKAVAIAEPSRRSEISHLVRELYRLKYDLTPSEALATEAVDALPATEGTTPEGSTEEIESHATPEEVPSEIVPNASIPTEETAPEATNTVVSEQEDVRPPSQEVNRGGKRYSTHPVLEEIERLMSAITSEMSRNEGFMTFIRSHSQRELMAIAAERSVLNRQRMTKRELATFLFDESKREAIARLVDQRTKILYR